MELAMKLKYPGLTAEKARGGKIRYRVRRQGRPSERITLPVTPDSPDFHKHYHAARFGCRITPETKASELAQSGSFGWLVNSHLEWLEAQVKAGQASPYTLKKRIGLLSRLLPEYGNHVMAMPTRVVVGIRDQMARTPASADSMVEALSVMYAWAIERDYLSVNPAAGVKRIDKGKGGATAWTVDDLKAFTARYPKGTHQHVALSVLLFTGCRIGDLCILGRGHEVLDNGQRFIEFQPLKKGSAFVSVPMLPQLYEATRAPTVVSSTYVVTSKGTPLTSANAASALFKKWCVEAGLENKSAHGVRKGLGKLLAEFGVPENAIAAILGHTSVKNTAVYTREAQRKLMAKAGMASLKGLVW